MKTQQRITEWDHFFRDVGAARSRALLLDYDGTLAPFCVERDQAVTHPKVKPALVEVCRADHTRVAVISGRAIEDLIPLLEIEPLPELWGNHGWERRLAGGSYMSAELSASETRALTAALAWACLEGFEPRCERKPASVALHWRGLSPDEKSTLAERARAAWDPLANQAGLELHSFEGGIELRVPGRDKGHAVQTILDELPRESVVAYAGDDYTDEDAFRALGQRGLRILVRPELRETAADVWMRSHEELAEFLNRWHLAAKEGVLT